jgi:hypothetical protein
VEFEPASWHVSSVPAQSQFAGRTVYFRLEYGSNWESHIRRCRGSHGTSADAVSGSCC